MLSTKDSKREMWRSSWKNDSAVDARKIVTGMSINLLGQDNRGSSRLKFGGGSGLGGGMGRD